MLLVVFYFLLIRPQNKRAKEQREMLSKIAQGDEVATTGGILGKVTEVGEQFLTLEIAERREHQAAEASGGAASAQGDGQERMISYPRWKIVLVAVVMRARHLPGTCPTCSARRTRCSWRATAPPCRRATAISVVQLLESKSVKPTGAFLDQGRLTLRFASKQDQLKARDLITEARPNEFTIALIAGLARSGLDAQPRT